jgi:hypothetical protein
VLFSAIFEAVKREQQPIGLGKILIAAYLLHREAPPPANTLLRPTSHRLDLIFLPCSTFLRSPFDKHSLSYNEIIH